MFSRRHFFATSISFAASGLVGCAISDQSVPYRVAVDEKNLKTFPGKSTRLTPLGLSIENYLAATSKSHVKVVYNGTLTLAHNTGFVMLDNSRSGNLMVTVIYDRPTAVPEKRAPRGLYSLNGQPINASDAPPFENGVEGFNMQFFGGYPMMTEDNGINSANVSGRFNFEGNWIFKGKKAVEIRPAGMKSVAALGKSVKAWKFSLRHSGTNLSGQPIEYVYESVLSDEVPGQLISYSYRFTISGMPATSSAGQILSIS